ncbi:AAA family ATPase [Maribellus maritimus]|uniref:AAA family ATPase n=1 Tax=Maribellus maritimus TaxID=2870838 RepID=UPI001EECD728|nr:AAA family ATPase [Maribellus maritimus]MCG6190204.1 AAA family ATPase [Maribellus maritimus]
MKNKKRFHRSFLISGRICSGKSTFANHISSVLNIPIVSFGKYVKHICISNGIEVNRTNLQIQGESLINHSAKNFLYGAIDFSVPAQSQSVIFEGIRHKKIVELISEVSDTLIIIYIEACLDERFRRFIQRGTEKLTKDQFIVKDNHNVEQEISTLKDLADLIIDSEKEIISNEKIIIDFISKIGLNA